MGVVFRCGRTLLYKNDGTSILLFYLGEFHWHTIIIFMILEHWLIMGVLSAHDFFHSIEQHYVVLFNLCLFILLELLSFSILASIHGWWNEWSWVLRCLLMNKWILLYCGGAAREVAYSSGGFYWQSAGWRLEYHDPYCYIINGISLYLI